MTIFVKLKSLKDTPLSITAVEITTFLLENSSFTISFTLSLLSSFSSYFASKKITSFSLIIFFSSSESFLVSNLFLKSFPRSILSTKINHLSFLSLPFLFIKWAKSSIFSKISKLIYP